MGKAYAEERGFSLGFCAQRSRGTELSYTQQDAARRRIRPARRGCYTISLSARDLDGALAAAVGTTAIQIDQNIPRLGAFAGADHAAIFQFIHDARRPRVTQPQPSLHQ